MEPDTQSIREFTLNAYASLLERTQAIYPFAGFEILAEPELPQRFCILRHDIDMSPKGALRLAEIEAERGVRATYTILLTGPQYSPFEKPTAQILKKIGELGHELGLHFDASWHDISDEKMLHSALRSERRTLEDLIEGPVRCFSFHNTTEFTMSARADSYGDLWNAYAGRIQEQVSYVSDSNGYWRFRDWGELLEEAPARLQVLTHAEWWGEQNVPPADRVCRLLEERSAETWHWYVKLLTGAGRSIVTGSPRTQAALLERLGELELMRLWLGGEREAAYAKLLMILAREKRERGRPNISDGELGSLLHELLQGEVIDEARLAVAFEAAALALVQLRKPSL